MMLVHFPTPTCLGQKAMLLLLLLYVGAFSYNTEVTCDLEGREYNFIIAVIIQLKNKPLHLS
jgi:hypothetical protein